MRTSVYALTIAALVALQGLSALPVQASSHREAPFISQDPAADNTDLYTFVSPDKPDTLTIIANYILLNMYHESLRGPPHPHSRALRISARGASLAAFIGLAAPTKCH